jgi:uncharacterized membrane protein YhaH (DUF805 family)
MGVQEAVLTCLSHYADFEGRADRPECWWWFLFVVAICVILWSVGGAILGVDSGAGAVSAAMFGVAAFLPSLAVGARRLHDTDRNGWWLGLLLLPVVGWAALLYFFTQRGMPGPNRFGDALALF